MKSSLSIQAYSVADHMSDEASARDAFRRLASYGFTGVQTAGPFTFGADKYAEAAGDAGLEIIGSHTSMDILKNTEEAVKLHRALGASFAGIGGMPSFFSGELTKRSFYDFIDETNEIASKLAEHGLRFTYHHHAFEFARVEGTRDTMLDVLLRELDPINTSFVLDTYWLQYGGASVTETISKFEGRLDIIHLKDMRIPFGQNDPQMTALGGGNLNFPEIIRAAEDAGATYLCYEQDGGHEGDTLESAKVSAEYFYSIMR